MTSRVGGLFYSVSPIDKGFGEAWLWGGESDQVKETQEGSSISPGIVSSLKCIWVVHP